MNTGPFLIMLAASLWAIDALIRTPLTKSIPTASIVLLEHLIGLIVLAPLFIYARGVFRKLTLIDWRNILLLTIVSSVAGTMLFTEALARSFTSGDFVTPLLLQKTQPLIVIFLSALILGERLTKRYFFWAPLALIGSYLMSFGLTPIQLQLAGKEIVFLLALGAAAAWGSGTILSKLVLKKLTYLESTFIRFFMAIPVSFAVAVSLGQVVPIAALSGEHLLRFVLIGLTTGAAALLIYYRGLAKTEAKISTLCELAFPFISILIAITPLNPYGAPQTLTTPNIVGIMLLLISVFAVSIDYAARTARIIVTGTVIHGAGDGKKIGFPTANIKYLQPPPTPYGVYACQIMIDGKAYDAIAHYGPRLVFGETQPQFEVHIFRFNKRIYGKTVVVQVKKFIRSTDTFPSVKKMTEQIRRDIQKAKDVL